MIVDELNNYVVSLEEINNKINVLNDYAKRGMSSILKDGLQDINKKVEEVSIDLEQLKEKSFIAKLFGKKVSHNNEVEVIHNVLAESKVQSQESSYEEKSNAWHNRINNAKLSASTKNEENRKDNILTK